MCFTLFHLFFFCLNMYALIKFIVINVYIAIVIVTSKQLFCRKHPRQIRVVHEMVYIHNLESRNRMLLGQHVEVLGELLLVQLLGRTSTETR